MTQAAVQTPPQADQEINLTGVVCPLNFVKTKLRLEMMQSSQILKVTLDKGEPIKNVPQSVKNEGHKILHAEDLGTQAAIWIRKA
jgi:tRNA 2-thiouridine synthesizing protein A